MKFPIIIEYSKIPIWISKITGVQITALSFWIFIICKEKLGKRTWRHEMIHYKQQKELFFVGQWFLYLYFILKGYIKYKSLNMAYLKNPFERECYQFENDPRYLTKRIKMAWKVFKL